MHRLKDGDSVGGRPMSFLFRIVGIKGARLPRRSCFRTLKRAAILAANHHDGGQDAALQFAESRTAPVIDSRRMAPLQRQLEQSGCDVRFDNLTRQLYATDASIYQTQPAAVAFPRSAAEASAVIRASVDAGLPVTPRGAGTSLSGGAIGEGLIVEFSRHNRRVFDLNREKMSVRVGAGVVLDQLNAFLRPYGFCFGPDVATSSRATLGGMIANNSSGARVPVYGTTADHVLALEIVLADGRIETIGTNDDSLGDEKRKMIEFISACGLRH